MMRARYSIKSIVLTLIIINVGIYFLSMVLRIPAPRGLLVSLVNRDLVEVARRAQALGFVNTVFSLFPVLLREYGFVWQVFTYMFLHGSFWHLFFNMYALLLFGRPLEQRWGTNRFFLFYVFTGVGAGIVTFIWNLLGNPYTPTIGASGAIFGIVLAFGLEFPDTMLLLFFLIPVRARYAAFIFGGIELIMILTGRMQGIGHFTHLAGLLFGYIFYMWRIRGKIAMRPVRRRMSAPKRDWFKGRGTASVKVPSGKAQARVLQQAEILRSKLFKGEALNGAEEKLLDKFRRAYNLHGREMCGPSEFEPHASDCLKCDALYACLYRYVLELQ
jgi:membrane associated rhomboid family serine protease